MDDSRVYDIMLIAEGDDRAQPNRLLLLDPDLEALDWLKTDGFTVPAYISNHVGLPGDVYQLAGNRIALETPVLPGLHAIDPDEGFAAIPLDAPLLMRVLH